MDAQESGRGGSGRDDHMTIEVEREVMDAGALFWVFGQDTEFSFVGGDLESPRAEPLGNVIDGSLEVGDSARAFAATPSRKGAVKVGVIRKLGARYVFGYEVREVYNKNQEEGGTEYSSLRNTVGHGNRRAVGAVVRNSC